VCIVSFYSLPFSPLLSSSFFFHCLRTFFSSKQCVLEL
jgi:hypothetical protein